MIPSGTPRTALEQEIGIHDIRPRQYESKDLEKPTHSRVFLYFLKLFSTL